MVVCKSILLCGHRATQVSELLDVSLVSKLQEVKSEAIQNASTMQPLWRWWKLCRDGSNPTYHVPPWTEVVGVEQIHLKLKLALEERLNHRLTRDG